MAVKTRLVKIGDRLIGEKYPVYIIAEIGFLFKSFEAKGNSPGAKDLIDLAIESGADAVKIQTFKAETIASPDAVFDMENTGKINQRKMFKRYQLNKDEHAKIFKYAKYKNITLFSTPSHPQDVDLLEQFNPLAYKAGSDDLTNIPFLKYIAKTKRPIILSTGLSTFKEVKNSTKQILKINKKLALLHCVSNYPAYPKNSNLLAINTLKKLNLPVGWSDHIKDSNITSFAAVALGANIIEKHFTDSKKNPSPDSMLAALPIQFKEMVEGIRLIESSFGDGIKSPTEQGNVFPENRKSIVAARDIKKGEIIKLIDPYTIKEGEKDFFITRPGYGLNAQLCGNKLKIKLNKNIKSWQPIKLNDITFVK